MSPVIRISSSVYSRLEQYAEGFDTPANVIEKLLDRVEGTTEKKESPKSKITKEQESGVVSIGTIVEEFKNEHQISLKKVQRKKIIFDGNSRTGKSIVVVTPESKIYPGGNGWVDFTEIQIDLFKRYAVAIAVFRLSDGNLYYVDLESLFPLLTEETVMENEREGRHWKLDIWSRKITIRNGGETLHVRPNKKEFLDQILSQS